MTFQDAHSNGEFPPATEQTRCPIAENCILKHSVQTALLSMRQSKERGKNILSGGSGMDITPCGPGLIAALLRRDLGCKWHTRLTFSQWLGCASPSPCPLQQKQGVSYSPKQQELGHTGTSWRAKMDLGPSMHIAESLSWKPTSSHCSLRRQKHFTDLRRCKEISLVLLGHIKIWDL